MKVDKISASFPADLGDAIREAAGRSGVSVSAWLSDAAARKLRADALRELLDDYQAEHGAFAEEEVEAASRALGLSRPMSAA